MSDIREEICMLCGHDPACGVLAIHDGDRYCHADDHSCYFEIKRRTHT